MPGALSSLDHTVAEKSLPPQCRADFCATAVIEKRAQDRPSAAAVIDKRAKNDMQKPTRSDRVETTWIQLGLNLIRLWIRLWS